MSAQTIIMLDNYRHQVRYSFINICNYKRSIVTSLFEVSTAKVLKTTVNEGCEYYNKYKLFKKACHLSALLK